MISSALESFVSMLVVTLVALVAGLVMMHMQEVTAAPENSTNNSDTLENDAFDLTAWRRRTASEAEFRRKHGRTSRYGTNQHRIRVRCWECGAVASWIR